jgi:hypothetical protein
MPGPCRLSEHCRPAMFANIHPHHSWKSPVLINFAVPGSVAEPQAAEWSHISAAAAGCASLAVS